MDYSGFRRSQDIEDRRKEPPISQQMIEALKIFATPGGGENLASLPPIPMPNNIGPLSAEAGLYNLDPRLLADLLKRAHGISR